MHGTLAHHNTLNQMLQEPLGVMGVFSLTMTTERNDNHCVSYTRAAGIIFVFYVAAHLGRVASSLRLNASFSESSIFPEGFLPIFCFGVCVWGDVHLCVCMCVQVYTCACVCMCMSMCVRPLLGMTPESL